MRWGGSRKEKKRKSSEIDRERWNRRADVEWDRSTDRVESSRVIDGTNTLVFSRLTAAGAKNHAISRNNSAYR